MRIPEGDHLPRRICPACAAVHYENPRIVVGCVPEADDGRILICLRAIEPRRGYWTIPAGFMENGETTLEGARRETWEEARARVEDEALYTIFDLPHINQVYMFYLARLSPPEFAAGPESLEVALFEEDAIPWEELAFPVVNVTLERFFADRRHGVFPVHNATLRPGDWGRRAR